MTEYLIAWLAGLITWLGVVNDMFFEVAITNVFLVETKKVYVLSLTLINVNDINNSIYFNFLGFCVPSFD